MINVTYDWVKPYFSGTKRGANYAKAVDEFNHVSFHFDGYFIPFVDDTQAYNDANGDDYNAYEKRMENPYFYRLIQMRRPSESLAIQAYRRIIYLPQTKSPCFKVYNTLRKIVKSDDWKIDYSQAEKKGPAEKETLEQYCEHHYPYFNSVENWIYNYGMKQMLVDPNAVCYILPLEKEDPKDESEYYRPFTFVASSRDVLDFKDNQYVVFKNEDRYTYTSGVTQVEGKKLTIITRKGVWEATQDTSEAGFSIKQIHKYDMKKLPAFRFGGIDKKFHKDGRLYESFLSPIIPGLDGAARETSDADAEVVQHVFSTMWYYSSQNCTHCQGIGKVKQKGKEVICPTCEGKGVASKSPYKDMVLNQATFDSEKMPTPPAGYIVKPTDMVKLQADRIKDLIYNALSSINMEWLIKGVGLSQSGIAKEVDRDELNNYVYGIAYHLVENIVKPIYYHINEWRVGVSAIVKDEETREKMLPRIPVPAKFDILTANVIEEQLKSAVEAKADPEIIDELEMEYAQKKFPNNPELRDRMKIKKRLDPFPGLNTQEKQDLLLSKVADMVDVLVSVYLSSFLEKAIIEDKEFMKLEYEMQLEKMYEYAKKKKTDMDAANKLKMEEEVIQNDLLNPVIPVIE